MSRHPLLSSLLSGSPLSEPDAESLFESLLSGAFDDAQITAILTAIQRRGVTTDELVGAARVMRRHVTRVECPSDPAAVILDTCGTGGAPKTFNISTAVALVVAAASPHHLVSTPANGPDAQPVPGRPSGSESPLTSGAAQRRNNRSRGRQPPDSSASVPSPAGAPQTPSLARILVAKHGNRSRSGRGSAEVLQKLGVNVDAPPPVQSRCLDEAGVCFCFAIHHHPVAKVAAPARRALGTPTIFNLLGPLTNPAGATRQLIGTYAPEFVEKLAHALSRLGATRAMVVHGSDGMDEITTTGPTLIAHVTPIHARDERVFERIPGSLNPSSPSRVTLEQFDPTSLGLPRARPDDLLARDLDHAAQIIRDILSGAPGPPRDIVLLNAAAALTIAGAAPDLPSALPLAAAALDSGRAATTLQLLAHLSNSAAPTEPRP